MGYRIPSEDRLAEAIADALSSRATVDSQRELGELVRGVLEDEDPDLRASDRRIRRVALDRGLVEVSLRTGTTDERARDTCPVCGAELERVENRTLDGDTTAIGTDCPGCPYGTGARHEVPLRYAFTRTTRAEPEAEGPF